MPGSADGQPPRRGAGPFKEMGSPPPESDRTAWLEYWQERQEAIPLVFHGDVLKAVEIPTVERLVRRGERIDWIPGRNWFSTNDFRWERFGNSAFEVKTTKAKYSTIRGRIYSSVKAARENHAVIKDRFLVDLGAEPLTEELRQELSQYNVDRSRFSIAQLVVMHGDGQYVDQIPLA